MVIDAGRIKHLGDLMHKSIASNGTAVTSNWRLSADGLTNVVWSPESPAGGVSYGSNANDIGNPSAPGASASVSRADHVHRGVRSVSHASNTYYGDITLETEGGLYIVKPSANTYRLGSTSTGGGAGSSLTVEEVDGAPTDSAVTKIKFPNGTLAIASHVATYTPAAGGAGALLGVVSYAPGSDSAIANTSSATLADVDATNLVVTFTAPASGNVLVRLTALQSGNGANYFWGLREGAADIGAPFGLLASSLSGLLACGVIYLSGISAGSHTYKWSHACGGTAGVFGGPTYGQATMEVWAAP